jgi:RimJ/RimL family protein N-acetyltransferase
MTNPILLDIPQTFETDRLIIRALRPGDGKAINEAVIETFDNLHPWMPWAKQRPTLEESEEYARRSCAKFAAREELGLLLIHKADGSLVGASGLHHPNWDIPKLDIGYWCRKRFEGHGYITEAVLGILRFGFETVGARRIQIVCDSLNERSQRVAERCGLRREGELRKHLAWPEPRTAVIFGMTDDDWKTIAAKA